MQELELKRLGREAELAVLAEEVRDSSVVKGGPVLFPRAFVFRNLGAQSFPRFAVRFF